MRRQIATLALAGTAMMGLALPGEARAEEPEPGHVIIANDSKEARKICVFKEAVINVIPTKCWTLAPGQRRIWDRGRVLKHFRAKVYRVQRGFDKVLATQWMASTTMSILTSNSKLLSSEKRKPKRNPRPTPTPGPAPAPPDEVGHNYRVKFCNRSNAEPVWLTIAASGGTMAIAEGYWKIERGECRTINYSERFMKAGGGYPDGGLLVMYRAFTTGENGRLWSGTRENEDPELCVNTKKQFTINPWITKDGNPMAERYPCDGDGETWKRFLYGPTLDKDVQIGKVDF